MSLASLLHVQSSWIGPSSEQGHFSEYLLLWQPRAAPGDLECFGRFGWYRILIDSVYIVYWDGSYLVLKSDNVSNSWGACSAKLPVARMHSVHQCPTDVTRGLNPLPWACCCSKLRMPLGLAMFLCSFNTIWIRFESFRFDFHQVQSEAKLTSHGNRWSKTMFGITFYSISGDWPRHATTSPSA